MTLVIIDERVADAVYDKDDGFQKGLLRELSRTSCFPIFSVWTEQGGGPDLGTRKFVSETIGQRSETAKVRRMHKIHDNEGVFLFKDNPKIRIHVQRHLGSLKDNPKIRIHVQRHLGSLVKELRPDEVDSIIIHQGVIDVLEQNKMWLGEGHDDFHLKILHELSPSVIITSGRGRTIRHIKNKEIPFVEFSIIKDNTYAGLSKYHLVRSVLSVAGEKRKAGGQA